ncbi:MAG: ferritin [Puniceicoccaceae bacterium]
MKLSDSIEKELNRQINQEMSAAYAYLATSAWFESENLTGFSKWMAVQRAEELEHAQRLITYLLDRGGHLKLEAVECPRPEFGTVMEAYQAALASEENNTRSIHALYELAVEEKDYSTQSFLKWFIDEQVEEESTMHEMIGLLEHAGDDRSALLVLNDQVGRRAPGET